MKVITRPLALTALLVLILAAAAGSDADDRDLIWARGAPPNVFIVFDSASTMVHDAETNAVDYIANGDDPGSKLFQAKEVMTSFLEIFPHYNYGFSYYEKEHVRPSYLNYLYEVAQVDVFADSDGDGVPDAATPTAADISAMADDTLVGEEIRLGSRDDVWHNTATEPLYPIRYGRLGDEEFVVYWDDATSQWTTEEPSTMVCVDPITGDGIPSRRVRSFLVNSSGTPKAAGDAPFYHRAYDWSAVDTGIQSILSSGSYGGQSGILAWKALADDQGFDITTPAWQIAVRTWALADLESALISSEDTLLTVREIPEVAITSPSGKCDDWAQEGTEIYQTQLAFVQEFVLYDQPFGVSETTQISSSQETLTSVEWGQNRTSTSAGNDCQGFQEVPFAQDRPIVPIPEPSVNATTGELTIPQTSPLIKSMLGPQYQWVYYFPTRGNNTDYYLPNSHEDAVPWTATVVAGGRRDLNGVFSDGLDYFQNEIFPRCESDPPTDPLCQCRRNFFLLVTDGVHTCSSSPSAPTNSAEAMRAAGIPVYVVAFGPESRVDNVNLKDLAGPSPELAAQGDTWEDYFFTASNKLELFEALKRVAIHIEQRTRSFAALAISSVQTTAAQKAFVSTFYPLNGRSIWQGRLHAYLVDPVTGRVPIDPEDGTPDEGEALWDAAEQLTGQAANRKVYFGDPASASVPGTRLEFRHDVAASRTALSSYIQDQTTLTLAGGCRKCEFSPGETVTGQTSGATGVVELYDPNTDEMLFSSVTGTFQVNEQIVGDDTRDDVETITAISSLFDDVVDFIRGVRDASLYDTDRLSGGVEILGDIFHSVPQLVGPPSCGPCLIQDLEGYRTDFFTTHQRRRFTLFVGANDGTFHAFDAGIWDTDEEAFDDGTGNELFAWVPLSVVEKFDNLATTDFHEYTVDATPTVADVYIDHDADASTDDEWRTMLLFGQRRGGDSYVCLDVTQPDTYDVDGIPQPGTGRVPSCRNDSASCSGDWPAFRWEFTHADLAQTWSRPLVGFLHVLPDGGDVADPTTWELRSVAIFGGGFDPAGDRAGLDATDHSGKRVYIVDMETGDVLFSYVSSGMVLGQVAALDVNVDGILERLYWGDTAGRVYRMDLPGLLTEDSTGAITNWPTPSEIFNAGAAQGFYLTPTLVPISFDAVGNPILAIAIGAGNRENIFAQNVTPNRFYVFTDRNPDVWPMTEASLEDVTTFDGTQSNWLQGSENTYGWYFQLPDQYEKVNTRSLVVDQKVIFSTFTPEDELDPDLLAEGLCKLRGNAKTYSVLLINGNPSSGTARYTQHDTDIDIISDVTVTVGADGRLGAEAMADNAVPQPVMERMAVPVRINTWKEE